MQSPAKVWGTSIHFAEAVTMLNEGLEGTRLGDLA